MSEMSRANGLYLEPLKSSDPLQILEKSKLLIDGSLFALKIKTIITLNNPVCSFLQLWCRQRRTDCYHLKSIWRIFRLQENPKLNVLVTKYKLDLGFYQITLS